MVARIQQLYQVENGGVDLDPEARRVLRHEQSVPLLAQIEGVRQDLARTVLPKSPLGDAVRSSRWVGEIGCLQAASKALVGLRSSIPSFRVAS
jgi:transposase IS66 family protein